MDNFPEQIHTLAKRVQKMKDSILTEEATKTSVIMPFFQILNYDVFYPEEFLPEFVADVGIKKGEKVDYAILRDGQPIILIETKSIQEQLSKHDSQLFRYFGTTNAKFAILTNGIIYRFYTDLEQQNKMDTVPFFEFNLFDIRDNEIAELYKFRKENFSIENILTTASELKYTNEIKQFLARQWENPTEDFILYILNNVYPGKKTRQVVEKFSGVVKKSLKQFASDMVNDKLKAALANNNVENSDNETEITKQPVVTVEPNNPQVVTTEDELEGYVTIKFLLKDIIPSDRIYYRDNLSYFNILLDDNIRKWICRLGLNGSNRYIQFNDEGRTTLNFERIDDLTTYKEKLIETVKKFL